MIKPDPPPVLGLGRKSPASRRGEETGGGDERAGAVPPGDVGSRGRWSRDAWRSPHRSRGSRSTPPSSQPPAPAPAPPCRPNCGGRDRGCPPIRIWRGRVSTPPSPCSSWLPGRLERLPGEAVPGGRRRPGDPGCQPGWAPASAKPASPAWHWGSAGTDCPRRRPASRTPWAAGFLGAPLPGRWAGCPRAPGALLTPRPPPPPPRCCPGGVNSCW